VCRRSARLLRAIARARILLAPARDDDGETLLGHLLHSATADAAQTK
jgi:hypothetical protein